MSAKPNAFKMAQSALYNHALAFSPYWGEALQSDEGVIHFNRLPKVLKSLQIMPGFNKRWMGGTCAMNIKFSHPTSDTNHSKIVFKGGQGGIFKGKTKGDFSARILSALDTDDALKKTLLSLDLDTLTVEVKEGSVECTLTPYGGGMAYLVIPPVKTAIPLPPEQILPLTQALEQISEHIELCLL